MAAHSSNKLERSAPLSLSERPSRKNTLTPRQRQELVALATELSFAPRTIVYRENAPEAFIYVCMEGVLRSYRELPSGKRRILTFRFPGDLFGLAENGRYVNTVQTITPVVAYRLPLEPLMAKLRQDGELQFQVLARITHELREAQRQTVMTGHRSAAGRVAAFIKMLRADEAEQPAATVHVPMSRSDIADFIGLSPESVSRATARLVRAGVLAVRGRHLRILQPNRLDELANDL